MSNPAVGGAGKFRVAKIKKDTNQIIRLRRIHRLAGGGGARNCVIPSGLLGGVIRQGWEKNSQGVESRRWRDAGAINVPPYSDLRAMVTK